jgi:hypothetical protein
MFGIKKLKKAASSVDILQGKKQASLHGDVKGNGRA